MIGLVEPCGNNNGFGSSRLRIGSNRYTRTVLVRSSYMLSDGGANDELVKG